MKHREIIRLISADRTRTNFLHAYEQDALAFLVKRVPGWISSDMLTALGFAGNVLVFLGFVLATYFKIEYLLIGVIGFIVSWLGDSLDGRVAYFRKTPRKWYRFSLDILVDWLGIILIGAGFIVFTNGVWEFVGFGFVVFYGWQMLIATLRYKVSGIYKIDSGLIGPTEVRILLSLIFIAEVLYQGSMVYVSLVATILLLGFNLHETKLLLNQATIRDEEERKEVKNLSSIRV